VTPPRVTVLQLDTRFPRIPGDVACMDTYARPPQILRVAQAGVARVVAPDPENVDIAPFLEAMDQATGDVIVTSCGFLAPFQDRLAAATDRPVIASALGALDHMAGVRPEDLAILTFDAAALGPAHLGGRAGYCASLLGLPEGGHLRLVIAQDGRNLDPGRAAQEVAALLPHHVTTVLLECTNLPPYKPDLRAVRDVVIHDILTEIERRAPGAIAPVHL